MVSLVSVRVLSISFIEILRTYSQNVHKYVESLHIRCQAAKVKVSYRHRMQMQMIRYRKMNTQPMETIVHS